MPESGTSRYLETKRVYISFEIVVAKPFWSFETIKIHAKISVIRNISRVEKFLSLALLAMEC